jgi:replicative DNA helicase
MLTRGTVNSEQIFSSMAEQMQAMSGLGLHILDKAGATISDIESEIITMQSKGGCDLIIVDYLQLMNSDNKYLHDPKDIVSEISNKLKNLARKYKIPILALSQLSRALEIRADKRPIMSDLRESGSLEQDADVVMFLYRDEVYNPKEPSSRGSAELIIRKNRQGRLGTINMMFDGARTAFSEVQQWQR